MLHKLGISRQGAERIVRSLVDACPDDATLRVALYAIIGAELGYADDRHSDPLRHPHLDAGRPAWGRKMADKRNPSGYALTVLANRSEIVKVKAAYADIAARSSAWIAAGSPSHEQVIEAERVAAAKRVEDRRVEAKIIEAKRVEDRRVEDRRVEAKRLEAERVAERVAAAKHQRVEALEGLSLTERENLERQRVEIIEAQHPRKTDDNPQLQQLLDKQRSTGLKRALGTSGLECPVRGELLDAMLARRVAVAAAG